MGDVVRGRPAERFVQLPRPAHRGRRRRQGRVLLGGRAWRHQGDHLPRAARRRRSTGERAQEPRRGQGRPGQHLPRDGARASDRDARVRADRGPALRGVRWVQRRGAPRPDQRRRGEGVDHRGRRLATRIDRPAQGQRGRRGRRMPLDRTRDHRPPLRERASVPTGARSLVPRACGRPVHRLPAGADGRRGPAVPAVHERHDREAQRHRAHDRRLPHAGRDDPLGWSSTSIPTTSTGARPTAAG